MSTEQLDQINQQMLAALTSDKPFDASLNVETEQPPVETPPDSGQQAEPEAQPPAGEQQGDPGTPPTKENDTPVVLAKDGKHTIPYSVVEGLRGRIQELTQQLAEREAAQQSNADAPVHEDLPALSNEDMELLREEFPDAIKRMELLEARIAKVKELEGKVAEHEQAAQRTAAQQAQEAIDSIPKLAHIQANDQRLFTKACEFDAQLQQDPEMVKLPLEERFSKALAAVEALYGPIVLPDEAGQQQGTTDPATQQPPANLSNGKPIQATKTVLPNTLSDLPTGSPPVHDPLANLAGQSDIARLGHFIGKTPDQIHAELNKIL